MWDLFPEALHDETIYWRYLTSNFHFNRPKMSKLRGSEFKGNWFVYLHSTFYMVLLTWNFETVLLKEYKLQYKTSRFQFDQSQIFEITVVWAQIIENDYTFIVMLWELHRKDSFVMTTLWVWRYIKLNLRPCSMIHNQTYLLYSRYVRSMARSNKYSKLKSVTVYRLGSGHCIADAFV